MRTHQLTAVSALLAAAIGLVVGLSLPAAAHEATTLISGRSIKEHSIAGNRLKHNTVTGNQIKESTLSAVPEAKTLPRLKWHLIAPLTTSDSWVSVGSPYFPAEYALDAQGVVHFRGALKNTAGLAGSVAFLLPKALQPTHYVNMPFVSENGVIGDLEINGPNVAPNAPPGGAADVAGYTSLDGVTYSVR